MTYIPDLTERYPEPEPTDETPQVGEVWEHMKHKAIGKIAEVHDHYVIMRFALFTDGIKIEMNDLKNQWMLIG